MEDLHKSLFALPNSRKYPLHNKTAMLQSFSNFLSEKDKMTEASVSEAESNFTKAGAYHGVDLDAIREARECYINKKASDNTDEFIEFSCDEYSLSMNKIANDEQMDKAIACLLDKRASLPRKALKDAALYVCGVAEALGKDTATPEMRELAKIAGLGVGDQADIEQELLKRGSLIAIPDDARGLFYETQRQIRDMDTEIFYKQENLEKICSLLENIDSLYGLDVHYGKTLKRPEDACFGQGVDDLLKEASDLLKIDSLDVTLSKTALFERADKVNNFFASYYGQQEPLTEAEMIDKVAALNAQEATMFLDKVQ